MTFSLKKIEEIIVAADFEALLGEIENEWFECKGQPYALDGDPGKRELAKDVSSLANYLGGYILIGVKTKTSLTHFGDEVEKIRPFEQALVNIDQCQKIIRDWIYPEIEGLSVEWVATRDDAGRGLVIIKIPQQNDSLKPFLIKKVLDEKKHVEIVFGYAERRRDTSQPLTVIDLQRALRSGLNYESNLNVRLDSLEALVRQATDHTFARAEQENLTKLIDDRVEIALVEGELKDKRAMVLAAYPALSNEIESIFASSDRSAKKYLENPPALRYGGFALMTDERVKIIRGELIRARSGGYKIIDLYRDGTLIFAVRGDGEFLAWATPNGKQRINPVSLVEAVYNYVSFYKLVLEELKEAANRIFLRVDLKNLHMNDLKSYLLSYGPDYLGFRDEGSAPDNEMTKVIEVDAKEFEAGRVSFQLLREIYLWFGLEEDKIPYTKTEDDVKMVDPEQIKNL
jgi:hypothetical protein